MNQKVLTGLTALSLISVIILFILFFSTSKTSQQATSQKAVAVTVDSLGNTTKSIFPVAYVNLDSLVQKYKLFKELEAQFSSKQMVQEQKFNDKGKQLEKDVYDLQTKAQKGLITSADYQQQGMALQAREQELMQESQRVSKTLDEEEFRLLKRVKDSIIATVKDFDKENNYEIILNNAYSSSVLFAKEELNITDTIEVLLNMRYNKALESGK